MRSVSRPKTAVYLAGRYDHREELAALAEILDGSGHFEITSRWIRGDHEMNRGDVADQKNPAYALDDLLDVLRADIVIHKTEDNSVGYTSGGRHVEFGIALASGKQNIIIGPQENVFHYLPGVQVYPDVPTLLQAFGIILRVA